MILLYFTMSRFCNALTLICLQTLKVKVKVLCDVFEKHESPSENGMLGVSLELVMLLSIYEGDSSCLIPEEKKIPLLWYNAHKIISQCYFVLFDFPCNFVLERKVNFDAILAEIRKLTANVEAVLLGVIIPLCQRNSGRLEEADREVILDLIP